MKLKLYLLVGLFLIHFSMLGTPSKMNEDRFANYLNVLTVPEPPTAIYAQIYAGTATLAALTATGTNLQWYAAPTGGEPLAITTNLVDGTTYYVSQTIEGIESSRTPVKAKKISDATQTVCNGSNVASLVTTSNAVPEITTHWFTSATGETSLEGTATLESESYYVEESKTASTVTVTNSVTYPGEIASDALGNIYIIKNNQTYNTYNLIKMNPDGTNIQTLLSSISYYNVGLAVDASGTIYISDMEGVKKMNNDGTNIQLIAGITNSKIALDSSGFIYVSNNGSIIKMNSEGTTISTIPMPQNQYFRPSVWDIYVDSSGNIYTSTYHLGLNGIQKRNSDGLLLETLIPNLSPSSFIIDPSGNIYFVTSNGYLNKMNNDGTNSQFLIYLEYTSTIAYALDGIYVGTLYNVLKFTEPYTSNRVLVNVVVDDALEAPTAITPINYNQNVTASALTATTEEAGLLWYNTATGGVGSTTAPIPNTATGGSTSYWVSSINEKGCVSARTKIVVTIAVQAPTATNLQIFAGTATFANLTATGVNLKWYTDATGGEPLAVTTALVDGTTYYVSQTSGSVESDRSAVTVKRISEASQTFCSYSGATIADIVISPSADATVEWFTTATEGTALEDTAVLSSGSYYVAQTHTENTTLVTSNRVLVNVVIETVQMPTAVSPINHVQGVVATALTTTSGGTKLWYTTATGGEASQEAPVPNTATVGSTSYWVATITTNGCESERLEIIVNINEQVPATHLHLDGVNDRVMLPSTVSDALSGGTEVTIEYWFKGNKVQSAVRFQNTNGFIVAGWGNSGGKSQFIISTDGSTNGVSCGPLTTVEDNTWHHLAMVWKKNTIFATYLDGVLQSSRVAANVNLPVFTGNVGFLGSYYANGEYTKGNLEDVRIWNVARTANQISSSKNCELNGTETGLIAYYKFNQGINAGNNALESTLVDATSNANNATLTNLALTGEGSNFLSGSPVVSGIVATGQATVTSPINYYQNETAIPLTATSAGTGLLWYTTATGGSGSINAPTPETATIGNTSYWVSSTSEIGCESERTEIVVTTTAFVLTITNHPEAITITGGQNTNFTATVNSNSANYQWQVSHDGGTTYTDLVNDQLYSGATTATLSVNNAPISMSGYQYKVKINGSELLSDAALLTVTVPDFNNNRFWKNRGAAGFSASDADYSVTALDANNMPYVAFADGANSNKATVMKFNGTSWVTVGTAGFSASSNVYNFSIVFDASNMPYVAYVGGDNLIEVKHFNGTSWTNVGTSGLANQAEGLSFALDASGTPYVAYVDYGANYKTTVRKLVANAWVLVGNAGFTAGESYDTSFAIDEQGTPYVVYRDESNDGKATAMKFNGSAWVSVGPSSGFSPDVAFYTSLSIDRAGTPYATFVDFYTDQPVVMKFNGSEWVMVGTPGFASGVLYSSSIALDGSGTPFIVYQDFDNNDKVTVKRFNGTSWTTVGESGFSMGAGTFTSLDVDASGTPYVGFIDAALGNKVTVMKFNGSNVETIWENGSWDNGEPSFTMKAIIDDTLMLSTDLQASAIELTTNGSITVATGTVLTVGGKIINNNTPAHFVVEDHGILLQQQDVANEGDITVNVNSFPLYRQDYTLWSSPVENQNLRSFSLQTLFNRFSSYDTAAGTGAEPVGAYVQEIFTTADMAAKTFTTANGYLIRMPNDWDDYVDNSIPGVSYPGVFKGIPQNGTISRALSTSNTGMNLVGNPYPSPISIDAFFDGNPGVEQTIYYWRKRNDASGSGYATFNALGFVSAQSEINNLDMEYVINPGQGFFVKTTGATQLNFNNTMRSSNTGGLFLRNAPEEKHRLWLRLSNSTGSVGQTLIGYTVGATENVDNGLDAAYFNDSSTALTSLINGDEYAIQGRSLPFSNNDIVPLGFKSALNGDYTLSLSNFDGVFATEQAVYLKDNTTGLVTNLKLSDYSFTTPAGVFNARFELRYDSTLDTKNPQDMENQILISSKDNTITINTGTAIMEKIELYDVSGRLLFEKSGLDKSKETFEHVTAANQVLLVKVTTQDKVSVTRKIVY
jgi:hypothetical protein